MKHIGNLNRKGNAIPRILEGRNGTTNRSAHSRWVLQVCEPGGECHGMVIARSRDKGYLVRLSERICRSQGVARTCHMICRYYADRSEEN